MDREHPSEEAREANAREAARERERDCERVVSRAEELLPEERRAGSDDPFAQAAEILEESDERVEHRTSPGSQPVERRHSEDTVDRT
jgi:hypothetical protein